MSGFESLQVRHCLPVVAHGRERGIDMQLLDLIVAPQAIETITLLCSSRSESAHGNDSLTRTDDYSTLQPLPSPPLSRYGTSSHNGGDGAGNCAA